MITVKQAISQNLTEPGKILCRVMVHCHLLTSPGPDLTRIAVSLHSSNRRVRPRLVWRNGTLLASPVVHGVTGHFSSCLWYLRVSPDDTRGCQCPFVLCLHQKGYLQRGVRALGSYQERTGKSGSFGSWVCSLLMWQKYALRKLRHSRTLKAEAQLRNPLSLQP